MPLYAIVPVSTHHRYGISHHVIEYVYEYKPEEREQYCKTDLF